MTMLREKSERCRLRGFEAMPSSARHRSILREGLNVNKLESKTTALLIIDVQKAFDEIEAAGNHRNNPNAERRIAELLATFRDKGVGIFHIRHASREASSRFRPGLPGYEAKEEARECPGEPIIVKHVNSAFIGTDLEPRLRNRGVTSIVIVGATTNHCVETTARMAGNLGFRALLVRDATWTFGRTGPDGDEHSAEEIHAVTLANLDKEFSEIVTTEEIAEHLGS